MWHLPPRAMPKLNNLALESPRGSQEISLPRLISRRSTCHAAGKGTHKIPPQKAGPHPSSASWPSRTLLTHRLRKSFDSILHYFQSLHRRIAITEKTSKDSYSARCASEPVVQGTCVCCLAELLLKTCKSLHPSRAPAGR